MGSSLDFRPLPGSTHPHPAGANKIQRTDDAAEMMVTLQLRRRAGHVPAHTDSVGVRTKGAGRLDRDAFVKDYGADLDELAAVQAFARRAGLRVSEADPARRTVIVHGSADAVGRAFDTELYDYAFEGGRYRSHDGEVKLPGEVADYVTAVVGLTNRRVRAQHHSAVAPERQRGARDPLGTKPLTPAQVAALYNFPAGDGAGQTIGLYEMETGTAAHPAPAGYAASDIEATMKALGNLPMPNIVDVPIDGTGNSGQSDGETGLDITVAGAIAPKATIAVYFAGGETQNMLHALQAMIHPTAGQPVPTIVSISYGWGADDPGNANFSDSEWAEFTGLFQDAATNKITVLVSSGDSGAHVESKTQAQTSYPASDIWVTACGGTTIGNVDGAAFDEWVWNDRGAGGPGATGGGISARFPVPAYQAAIKLPARVGTGTTGRGVPDIAGNASENSGYLQVIGGQPPQSVGGTSAVAPLYAGLLARINANNGFPAGYLNTLLYALPGSAFRDIGGAPGPANNNFGDVEGYPAQAGWDACTGLGSVNGQALQAALAAAANPAT